MADRDLVRKDRQSSNASSPRGTNYLLAIAIDDYHYCTKLNNAIYDAEAFVELMTSRYNYEPENLIFLKNEQATKREIERAFDQLIDLITPDDNLTVYYSGHGRYHPRRGGFWIPVEGMMGDLDWSDYISNSLIKDYIGRIKSFHTFLISDSCFSGSLFIDRSRDKFIGDRRDTEPSRWGLTSGKSEIVSDGPPGEHSPFASALLDVLSKVDQPPGVMRVCDLVLEKVAANAHQTPMGSPLQVQGHQGGQMVLYFRDNIVEYAWTLAKSKGTIEALLEFERSFPGSDPIVSGELQIEQAIIQDRELWFEARRINTLDAYQNYLESSHRKQYLLEANRHITLIKETKRETEFWEKSLIANTAEVYEAFLKEFPSSIYAKKAKKFIRRLKEEAEEHAILQRQETNLWKKFLAQTRLGRIIRSWFWFWKVNFWKKLSNLLPTNVWILILIAGAFLYIRYYGFHLPWTYQLVSKKSPLYPYLTSINDNMVYIKGGQFIMGTDSGRIDEGPAHAVTIKGFYLSKYEVTVLDFDKFIEDTGYLTDADKLGGSRVLINTDLTLTRWVNWRCDPDGRIRTYAEYLNPVIHISWNDATAYCKWLSAKTGLNYRLPTEAEWAYAAGNGLKNTKFAWGNQEHPSAKVENLADSTIKARFNHWKTIRNYFDGYPSTAPVGALRPNKLGLYHMGGNVSEWCQDWYSSDYFSVGNDDNPTGPSVGVYRVIRGGNWASDSSYLYVSTRGRNFPYFRDFAVGFRIAR